MQDSKRQIYQMRLFNTITRFQICVALHNFTLMKAEVNVHILKNLLDMFEIIHLAFSFYRFRNVVDNHNQFGIV